MNSPILLRLLASSRFRELERIVKKNEGRAGSESSLVGLRVLGTLIALNPHLRLVVPAYLTLLLWSITSTVSINGPVMPLYVESLGIGIIGWGELAASWALGMFLFEWIWGSLSDRTDRRMLMLLSVLCTSVLSFLFTIHNLLPFFIILQFGTGVMSVAIGPTTRTYVANESPEGSLGLYASLWWAFFALGRVIGPLLGTFIAQTWSFEYSFWASSLLSVGLGAFVLLSFPADTKHPQGQSINVARGAKSVLSLPSVRFLFLAAIFIFMGRSVVISFLPLYASNQIKMSTVDVGVLVASVSGAQLFAMPLVGWFSDKFGRKRTAVLGSLISSILFLLYFFAGTSYQLLLVSIAIGLGFSGTSLLLAMIPDVTPSNMHGTAIGIYGSFEDLGVIAGPLVYGFVWSVFGPVYIFAATSITQLIGALLTYRIGERGSRPTLKA